MKKILFSMLCVATAMSAFAQAYIANGTYLIKGVGSGLNLSSITKSAGSNIQTSASAVEYQQFIITNTGNNTNTYTLKNVASGLFVDASGAGASNGTPIIQWGSSSEVNAANQQWQFFANGNSYEIRGKASEKDLAVDQASTTPAANIILYTANTGANQLFTLSTNIPTSIANGAYSIKLNATAWLNIGQSSTSTTNPLSLTNSAINSSVFTIVDLYNGYYAIYTSSGQVLDVTGNGRTVGTTVGQWPWSAADNQQWAIKPFLINGATNVTYYTITGKASGLQLGDKSHVGAYNNGIDLESGIYAYTSWIIEAKLLYLTSGLPTAISEAAVPVAPASTKAINVFPNAAHTSFTVSNLVGTNTVTVYNEAGQQKYVANTASNSMNINCSTYANGTYFIKVVGTDNKPAVTITVVKN